MKEAMMKDIDTLTQEDLHGAFQKLLERYNKSIAAGGDYFEEEFHVCTINKSAHPKKSLKTYFMTLILYIRFASEHFVGKVILKIVRTHLFAHSKRIKNNANNTNNYFWYQSYICTQWFHVLSTLLVLFAHS